MLHSMVISYDYSRHNSAALKETNPFIFQTTKTHPLSKDKLASAKPVVDAFSLIRKLASSMRPSVIFSLG